MSFAFKMNTRIADQAEFLTLCQAGQFSVHFILQDNGDDHDQPEHDQNGLGEREVIHHHIECGMQKDEQKEIPARPVVKPG